MEVVNEIKTEKPNEGATLRLLQINVYVDEKQIVNDFNLTIRQSELHVLMGPNGSGKSTLIYGILKHPRYRFEGKILLDDEDISKLSTDELANRGITATFQSPMDLEDIKLRQLLWNIAKKNMNAKEFNDALNKFLQKLKFDSDILTRGNFSGGEKKRIELLQMLFLKPKFLFVDEIDSGVDVDNLKLIAKIINELKANTGILLITHYSRILEYLDVDYVHLYNKGKIIKSGTKDFAYEIEKQGYEKFLLN